MIKGFIAVDEKTGAAYFYSEKPIQTERDGAVIFIENARSFRPPGTCRVDLSVLPFPVARGECKPVDMIFAVRDCSIDRDDEIKGVF